MTRGVFLDRDGVINRVVVRDGRSYPPASVDQFEFLPDVAGSIRDLQRSGYRVIVVTNQPDVAKGVQTREVVEAMHRLIEQKVGVDGIRVCYHVDEDRCQCRKPKPGMLVDAAAEWRLDLSQSFMVGDRWRDVGAGNAAGCTTILINADYSEPGTDVPDASAGSLPEATRLILAGRVSPGERSD